MRLLESSSYQLKEFLENAVPPYAILSHRWESEEVTFQAMHDGSATSLKGWTKIVNSCRRAAIDGYEYVWIDTCCIDKSSSAELSEAINTMFRWYRNSKLCYVYMSDVEDHDHLADDTAFRASKWFTRGWTLQELIAPRNLHFYDSHWNFIGDRRACMPAISQVTGISEEDVENHEKASIATRMLWASKRVTTRGEDIAYCMLGLFDVNMPLLYGEGSEKAFYRLQREIILESHDESIFAWVLDGRRSGLLAKSPACFAESQNITWYPGSDRAPYYMTNKGLHIELDLVPCFPDGKFGARYFAAPLNCRQLGGGQICIFLAPLRSPGEFSVMHGKYFRRLGPLGQLEELSEMKSTANPRIEGPEYKKALYVVQRDEDEGNALFDGLHANYKSVYEHKGRQCHPNPRWRVYDSELAERVYILSLMRERLVGLDEIKPGGVNQDTFVRKWNSKNHWYRTNNLVDAEDLYKHFDLIVNGRGQEIHHELRTLRERSGLIYR